jgi:DNA-binding NtrC family response regulator
MIGNVLTDKILVIDDDEAVNAILTRILSSRFGVESHFNAEDALRQCDFTGLDVVLTDVNLPALTVLNCCGWFTKKIHAAVIMITGENDIDVAISALKNGATDFILKPFNFDQIMIAVDRARERRRLQRENILLMSQLQNQNAALEELNRRFRHVMRNGA